MDVARAQGKAMKSATISDTITLANGNHPAPRRRAHFAWGEDELGLRFATCYRELSRRLTDLLGAVVCDPTRAMPEADAAGVRPSLFRDFPDLLAIFVAVDYGRRLTRDERWGIIPYAKFLLRRQHQWDDDAPAFDEGSLWSEARLLALLDRMFYCPPYIRQTAQGVISLERRIELARDYAYSAMDTLDGAEERAKVQPRTHIYLTPLRKRGA